ncbi:hypothetical protein V8C40DRAFT_70831 [Trichoderma camerunense]
MKRMEGPREWLFCSRCLVPLPHVRHGLVVVVQEPHSTRYKAKRHHCLCYSRTNDSLAQCIGANGDSINVPFILPLLRLRYLYGGFISLGFKKSNYYTLQYPLIIHRYTNWVHIRSLIAYAYAYVSLLKPKMRRSADRRQSVLMYYSC